MSIQATLRSLKKSPSRTMATWARQNQTFILPDGRVLGFAEYGSPDGSPILYFHGYPSSRLEARPIDEMARRRSLRVIALDRPGFGLSTRQPDRHILDWPVDVQAFAQGMRLPRFMVLGLSGGGPFALACAHALPGDMLTAVGLFATGPPWAAGAQHMSLFRRATSVAATYWPNGLRVAMNALVGLVRWLVTTSPIKRRIDSWLDTQKRKEEDGPVAVEAERAKPTTAERRKELLRILIDEPFAQKAEAAVHEAKLLSSLDWGFRVEDVGYNVVRIWHGTEDKNAPVIMIRYLAERLPHCVLQEFEGDTHYTMFKHLDRALSELVSEATKER